MAKNKRPPITFNRPDVFKLVHGITKDEYNIILERQSNCCKICGKHKVNFKKQLLVDKVGDKVRGLLCPTCKASMDALGENAINVISYLEE